MPSPRNPASTINYDMPLQIPLTHRTNALSSNQVTLTKMNTFSQESNVATQKYEGLDSNRDVKGNTVTKNAKNSIERLPSHSSQNTLSHFLMPSGVGTAEKHAIEI
jgi:hypothetical protein